MEETDHIQIWVVHILLASVCMRAFGHKIAADRGPARKGTLPDPASWCFRALETPS